VTITNGAEDRRRERVTRRRGGGIDFVFQRAGTSWARGAFGNGKSVGRDSSGRLSCLGGVRGLVFGSTCELLSVHVRLGWLPELVGWWQKRGCGSSHSEEARLKNLITDPDSPGTIQACLSISSPKRCKKSFRKGKYMNTPLFHALRRQRTLLPLFLCLGALHIGASALAQPIQREWVRNYSLQATGMNRASAIAMAPDGNVIVVGGSHNAAGNEDYCAIKYSAAGEQLWVFRHDGFEGGADVFRGMALDPIGNLFITGTTETVKVSTAGTLTWAVPIPGRAVVANRDFVYVTGASDVDIVTVQLENNTTDGAEVWRRTYNGPADGVDVGQVAMLDTEGNVYVSGSETLMGGQLPRKWFLTLRYSPEGVQTLRTQSRDPSTMPPSVAQVNTLVIAQDRRIFVYGKYQTYGFLLAYDSNGTQSWSRGYSWPESESGTQMVFDGAGEKAYVTGRRLSLQDPFPREMIVAKVPTAEPEHEWLQSYISPTLGWTEGVDISLDALKNVYVTGYSQGGPNENDLFLVKYDQNGNRLGLDRFNSSHSGSDFGEAMVVDTNGNVYVTGYSIFVGGENNGGSEFLTVKYSAAPRIERVADGAMELQFHTSPGKRYAIEATTDFVGWTGIYTNTANASGVLLYRDAAATNHGWRFYRGNSEP